MVELQVDAEGRGIYLSLFTNLEGIVVLVFTNQLDKNEKSDFCKLKPSVNRNFVYNLQTFLGFCQVHFYDFVANSA